jgi:head-tail adaptor
MANIVTQSGKLRHRIDIQSVATTLTSPYNEDTTEVWTTDRVDRASVSPLTGRELVEAAQVNADVTHKVTMRYVPNLTSTRNRLLYPVEYTTLSAAIEDTDPGAITLTSNAFLLEADPASGPTTSYILKIDSENILCSFASDTVTAVTRGAFGTTAATHAVGAAVKLLKILHIIWPGDVDSRHRRMDLYCKTTTL